MDTSLSAFFCLKRCRGEGCHSCSVTCKTQWTNTIDAKRFGIDIPEGAPVSQQERAYTSPIWYTP